MDISLSQGVPHYKNEQLLTSVAIKNRSTHRLTTPFVSADTHGPKEVFQSIFWILKSIQNFLYLKKKVPRSPLESLKIRKQGNFWFLKGGCLVFCVQWWAGNLFLRLFLPFFAIFFDLRVARTWDLFFLKEHHLGVLSDTHNMVIRRLENFLRLIEVQRFP